jgi:DNA polymerase III epsilon subunit-like protein
MQKFVVADTETACLRPPRPGAGVCDVALAWVDKDANVLSQVESLIDPECAISPSAMGVHHITEQMVWDKPTLLEFAQTNGDPLKKFGEHVPGEEVVLIGHNIRFDQAFLSPILQVEHRLLCTLKLARLTWPTELEDHKLQTLRYTFGLDAGAAHRAMGDVITCINLLRLLMKSHETDLPGLLELAKKPLSPETKMSFGKHKGTPLKSLPRNYVSWLLDPDRAIDPDLRDALLAL